MSSPTWQELRDELAARAAKAAQLAEFMDEFANLQPDDPHGITDAMRRYAGMVRDHLTGPLPSELPELDAAMERHPAGRAIR